MLCSILHLFFLNFITNTTGAADRVVGAKAYTDRFRAKMHKEGIEIHINLPQMIEVKPGQVLVLIGGKIVRDGQEIFHNIGGYLINEMLIRKVKLPRAGW